MDIGALLAHPPVLPSIPRVLALVLGELAQPQPDLRKITQLVRTDPALTARLLRAANAPAHGMAGQVGSVIEALTLLRLDELRDWAEQAAATASLRAAPGIDLPLFWAYSLDVAKYARALAGIVRQNQGAAYTCGLLHALGELLMHGAMPETMHAISQEAPVLDLRRVRVETRHLGYGYAEVSAALARLWQLPSAMVEALAYQSAPFDNDAYEPLAGVIHLATWRARAEQAGLSERALADSFPGPVGEVLHLDLDAVLQQDPFDWLARA